MAYDEQMAARIRAALGDADGLVEKKMFGGIGWTLHGNMAVGVHNDGRMMVRCAKDDFAEVTSRDGANPMMRGDTPMTGWVLIDAETVEDSGTMQEWVEVGRSYAESLPPK
jgi:TfoX/Sxy family transcriptional regulator of competence genes